MAYSLSLIILIIMIIIIRYLIYVCLHSGFSYGMLLIFLLFSFILQSKICVKFEKVEIKMEINELLNNRSPLTRWKYQQMVKLRHHRNGKTRTRKVINFRFASHRNESDRNYYPKMHRMVWIEHKSKNIILIGIEHDEGKKKTER